MRVHFFKAICDVCDCKIQLKEKLRLCFTCRLTVGFLVAAILMVALLAPNLSAQGLDPAALLKPPMDAWPTYNGDYSGRRFSTLDQIKVGDQVRARGTRDVQAS